MGESSFRHKVLKKALGDSMRFRSLCQLVPESSAEWVPLIKIGNPNPWYQNVPYQNEKAFYLTCTTAFAAPLKCYYQFWSIGIKRLESQDITDPVSNTGTRAT